MIELFAEKKNCCGCTACMNICPKKAINMKIDEYGYTFPCINNDLCIECEQCKRVCAFQNEAVTGNKPIETFAAVNKDLDVLLNSASGGVFGALASIILEKNGVVFGCAYNSDMEPEHIWVDNKEDLKKIQGSKYVQSSLNCSYSEVKRFLNDNKWVLFTGTPCQVAGLKSYLNKEYDMLVTADIVCHGVPSAEFFKGYVKHLEDELEAKVIDFKFRDKTKGWGLTGKLIYEKDGKKQIKFIVPATSYYYRYFLEGHIYRENCYECKYACGSREGDFTMGDYWGIEKAHPEVIPKKGVSALLVNSSKGILLLKEIEKYLNLTRSTFEQARVQNEQLKSPSIRSDKRDIILELWRDGGYKALATYYYISNRKQILMLMIKGILPQSAKRVLKNIVNR